MRRKPGTLLPLEVSILQAAFDLRLRGTREFHGYLLASHVRERAGAKLLTGHGTLYKALDRMQKAGLLESRWEDPAIAAAEDRPRRRLYTVTGVGERALADARMPAVQPQTQPGMAPS